MGEAVVKGTLVLLVLVLIVVGCVSLLQYTTHAVERHGEDAIQARSLFERCDQLPTAELKTTDRVLYLCFIDEVVKGLQVTTEEREAPNAREITSFSKCRDWECYLKTALQEYQLNRSWGDMPRWFARLLEFL